MKNVKPGVPWISCSNRHLRMWPKQDRERAKTLGKKKTLANPVRHNCI